MIEKRKALGRGLDTLLPSRQASVVHQGEAIHQLAIELIDRNPYQTRSHVDEASLAELAASISATGVLQPITVRAIPEGRFQLIAGERRWMASQLAGKSTVPAIVRQVSDEQAVEMTIIENLQREDLNPIEQARAFDRLGREFGLTQEQISLRTGKERSSVANFLRLLRMPESIQATSKVSATRGARSDTPVAHGGAHREEIALGQTDGGSGRPMSPSRCQDAGQAAERTTNGSKRQRGAERVGAGAGGTGDDHRPERQGEDTAGVFVAGGLRSDRGSVGSEVTLSHIRRPSNRGFARIFPDRALDKNN